MRRQKLARLLAVAAAAAFVVTPVVGVTAAAAVTPVADPDSVLVAAAPTGSGEAEELQAALISGVLGAGLVVATASYVARHRKEQRRRDARLGNAAGYEI